MVFLEFSLGEQHPVVVQKILTGGVLVELQNGETEFVHKSKISNEFINDINDFVAVGDNYVATVIVGKNKPTELSLRECNNITRRQQNTETEQKAEHKAFKSVSRENHKPTTLEEMISQSTAAMREKYQGRDKETGARYRKRKNKNGGRRD